MRRHGLNKLLLTMILGFLAIRPAHSESTDPACLDDDANNDYAIIFFDSLPIIFVRCPPPPPKQFRLKNLSLQDRDYKIAWENTLPQRVDYQRLHDLQNPPDFYELAGSEEELYFNEPFSDEPSSSTGLNEYQLEVCSSIGCQWSEPVSFTVPDFSVGNRKVPVSVSKHLGSEGFVVDVEIDAIVQFMGPDEDSINKEALLTNLEDRWTLTGLYDEHTHLTYNISAVFEEWVSGNVDIRIDVDPDHYPATANQAGGIMKIRKNTASGAISHEFAHILWLNHLYVALDPVNCIVKGAPYNGLLIDGTGSTMCASGAVRYYTVGEMLHSKYGFLLEIP